MIEISESWGKASLQAASRGGYCAILDVHFLLKFLKAYT